MKTAIIVPLQPAAVGGRYLSSYLRANGQNTRLVFIPSLIPEADGTRYARDVKYECSDRLKDAVVELIQDADVVGFSVLAHFFDAMADLSAAIRGRTGKPAVWGGPHVSASPDSCLAHADILCLGDGEDTLLDIVANLQRGESTDRIPGTVSSRNGHVIRAEPRRAEPVLDRFPYLDFSFDGHFYIVGPDGREQVVAETPEAYRKYQKRYPTVEGEWKLLPYKTISARGCPYSCTYCSIGSQDKKALPFRARSVSAVIGELETVLAAHGDMIDVISLSDDTFLNHAEAWIADFSEQYEARIRKPFRVLGHPLSTTARKLEMLAKAGCMHFGMGIESLSRRVLFDVFNRKTPVPRVLESANIMVETAKAFKTLPPTFDVILGNPYQSPDENLESFRSLTLIARPAKFVQYHLNWFPGSVMFSRALADGIITSDDPIHYRASYLDKENIEPYLRVLHTALNEPTIPRWLLRALSGQRVFAVLNHLLKTFPQGESLAAVLLRLSRATPRKVVSKITALMNRRERQTWPA
jgi:radical SAM superfamily enzyme YgiQ (UPF0313 family)